MRKVWFIEVLLE